MYKLKSVLKNETHKIFWDYEIQTDHIIWARRLHLELINLKKEKLLRNGFCNSSVTQNKNKRK